MQYTNHLGLCTEEISDAGDAYVPQYDLSPSVASLLTSVRVADLAMPSRASRTSLRRHHSMLYSY